MNFDDMTQAVSEAKRTLSRADAHVKDMADMIAGRLRQAEIGQYTLRKLKNELRDYNPHTGVWK